MLRYRSMVLVLVGVAVGWCGQHIICPDGKLCDSYDTCCRTASGYSCCPYPQAVCCTDQAHCCPNGYICDLASQTCKKAGHPLLSVPMRQKIIPGHTSLTRPNENQRGRSNGFGVERCNSFFYCPVGSSCCQGATDQWSCCPYPLGHCCSDGVHCCENGYTCDVSNLKCRKGFTDAPPGTKKDAQRF